jgi:hypothetical protein
MDNSTSTSLSANFSYGISDPATLRSHTALATERLYTAGCPSDGLFDTEPSSDATLNDMPEIYRLFDYRGTGIGISEGQFYLRQPQPLGYQPYISLEDLRDVDTDQASGRDGTAVPREIPGGKVGFETESSRSHLTGKSSGVVATGEAASTRRKRNPGPGNAAAKMPTRRFGLQHQGASGGVTPPGVAVLDLGVKPPPPPPPPAAKSGKRKRSAEDDPKPPRTQRMRPGTPCIRCKIMKEKVLLLLHAWSVFQLRLFTVYRAISLLAVYQARDLAADMHPSKICGPSLLCQR